MVYALRNVYTGVLCPTATGGVRTVSITRNRPYNAPSNYCWIEGPAFVRRVFFILTPQLALTPIRFRVKLRGLELTALGLGMYAWP